MRWDDIQGWSDDIIVLYRHLVNQQAEPATYVELGCWLGRSTAFLAQEIVGQGKSIDFYAVDWGMGSEEVAHESDIAQHGEPGPRLVANLLACDLLQHVTLLLTSTGKAAGMFQDNSVDFVLIDASHTFEDVKADCETWWTKVRPGGILAGHDYDWPSVALAVHRVFGPAVPLLGDPSWCHCWGYRKQPDGLPGPAGFQLIP